MENLDIQFNYIADINTIIDNYLISVSIGNNIQFYSTTVEIKEVLALMAYQLNAYKINKDIIPDNLKSEGISSTYLPIADKSFLPSDPEFILDIDTSCYHISAGVLKYDYDYGDIMFYLDSINREDPSKNEIIYQIPKEFNFLFNAGHEALQSMDIRFESIEEERRHMIYMYKFSKDV